MDSIIGEMIPIFAIIFTFGIPGIIIFWYINARHRERMRLIEKGLSAEEIKKYFQNVYYRGKNPYSALKWGILLASIGLGFVLSEILNETTEMSDSITPAILLLFAGLGFLIYYLIVSKKKQNGITPNNQQV
jgi:uncharacterized protein DUF6249